MSEAGLGRRLEGKVALITGAGRGIGRAIALTMAREGASVLVSDIGIDDGVSRAETVVAEVEAAGGRAVASLDDISSSKGAANAVGTAEKELGGLDILVNFAGLRAAARIEDFSEEDWDVVVDSHLKAAFLCTKYAIPALRKRGGGMIVNAGSEAGLGMPFNVAYASAKEGMAGLTRTVAREYGHERIRCNVILPRAALGTGGAKFGRERFNDFLPARNALGPYGMGNRGHTMRPTAMGTPEPVAEFITWLCTDAASELNGMTFLASGDEIAIFSQPDIQQSFMFAEWSPELIDQWCRIMTMDIRDRFRVEMPPEALKVR